MPFQIGGHPGFHCPLYKEESYDDYELVFEKKKLAPFQLRSQKQG